LFFLLTLMSVSMAQYPFGRLLGVVRGPKDEPLSGVTVLLSREAAPRQILRQQTNLSGEYQFLDIPPATYTLELHDPGMQTFRRLHVDIRSATTAELNVTLSPVSPSPNAVPSRSHYLDRNVAWGSEFTPFALAALPNARNIWALLESQEPSTVTNRLDVGGLETGTPALFGAMGASWTENQYLLNGFDVTDPYVPGRPLGDPDFDAVSEFQVTSGSKPAWLASSGVALAISTPEPHDAVHGATRLFYSGHGTQSDNMDARLRQDQFPGPERLDHLADVNAQVGGKLPLEKASWPAFLSLSTQQLGKHLGGFDAPIDVHVDHALAELTPLCSVSQRLNLLYAGEHIFNSREGALPQIAPSATTLGNDNYHQFQARWNDSLNPSSLLAVGFGVTHAIVSSGFQPGLQEASNLDLPLMTQSGSAPLSTAGERTIFQTNVLYEAVPENLWGRHSLDMGLDWERSYVSNRWDALTGEEQVFVNGAGEEVVRWNTPTEARQHVQNASLFVQDAWRPAHWLCVPLGLRMDTSSGRAAGVENEIQWTTLQPKAGLVLPLAHSGLLFRASWSRYGHLLQGHYLDFGNPAALGEQVFGWQDLNDDGQAQPQEITQLLQVSGGPYSEVDRGLARPFTDEISLELEREFRGQFRASVRFYRRDDHRLIGLEDVGVPFSSYTPVQFLDPGNDQFLTLYNRDPSALGKDFFLLTNPPGDRASAKGFEIRLTKPLVRRWEFSASFTAMQTLAPTSPGNSVFQADTGVVGSLYTDPNTLLYDTSRTYFDRAFIGKVTGYYLAPRRFQLAAVVKYYDGLPFARILFVNGFNQGPFFVQATPRGHPGGFQTQFDFTLDARLAREFTLRRHTISGYLDCFNCLNMNRNTLEADLTSPTFQSRVPLAVEAPRVVRIGLEWKF
jgi:hypothetical protein